MSAYHVTVGVRHPRVWDRRRGVAALDVIIAVGRQEIGGRHGDLDVRASAPSMPMKLIAPLPTRVTAAESSALEPPMDVAWGLRAVGADTSPFDGAGVVVAVLDTGIDRRHAAFRGVRLVERDFTGEGNGDVHGHGTHCAGTILGRDTGGARIGVARGVTTALIGKVIGGCGGTSAGTVSAIHWAVENGANVISMSLGIDFPGYQAQLQRCGLRPEPATSLALEGYRQSLKLFDIVAELVSALAPYYQPCLLIAAAGNESGRDELTPFEIAVGPPAVSAGIVSVGALEDGAQGLAVAPFSNTGATVCGPGVRVMSAKAGGGLVSMDGTSMATPHVAGVAALWAQRLAQDGRPTPEQLTTALISSATTTVLSASSTPEAVGAGIVQAPQR